MLYPDIHTFAAALPRDGRLLGLDWGTKTIGMALSDGLRSIATPQHTISRTKFGQDAVLIQEFVKKHAVCGVVLGDPVNMDGSAGPRAQSVRDYALQLATKLALPTVLWDERLSTVAAERVLLESDVSRARRDELVDKLAASYILQGALDRLNYLAKHP